VEVIDKVNDCKLLKNDCVLWSWPKKAFFLLGNGVTDMKNCRIEMLQLTRAF